MIAVDKHYTEETLGERLKRLRKIHGFTQQQVADALNLDRSTYTYYEVGKTEPNHRTTIKLARIFEVSVQEIITGEMVPVSNDAKANMNMQRMQYNPYMRLEEEKPSAERSLITKYRSLSDEKREELEAFVAKLVEEDTKKRGACKNK